MILTLINQTMRKPIRAMASKASQRKQRRISNSQIESSLNNLITKRNKILLWQLKRRKKSRRRR